MADKNSKNSKNSKNRSSKDRKSESGKGDAPRPTSVSAEEIDLRWELVFGNPKPKRKIEIEGKLNELNRLREEHVNTKELEKDERKRKKPKKRNYKKRK